MFRQCLIKRSGLAFLCLIFLMPGCVQPLTPSPAPTPIPAPQSQRISEFLWQQDGDYGYMMLRPSHWAMAEDGAARVYYPDPQDDRMRLSLTAINLNVYRNRAVGGETDVRWTSFRDHLSLEGWTDALMRRLHQRDIVRLEHSLDTARIYSVRSMEFSLHIQLVAYVIHQATPFEITLNVGGAQARMEEVEQSGLMEDFLVMVKSVRAAPEGMAGLKPLIFP